MKIQKDSSDQYYIELDVNYGGAIRITKIPYRDYAEDACFRIEVRDESGHIRRGPEIPVRQFFDVVKGAGLLLADDQNAEW